MLTEKEIRSHIADLRIAKDPTRSPCGCAGTDHETACVRGRMYMDVAITVLDWVIGINHDYNRVVEHMAMAASIARAKEAQ